MPFIIRGHARTTHSEVQATVVASEAFGGIGMLTACGAEEQITARFCRWVEDARVKAQATSPLMGLQFGLIFFGLFSTFGLAFWYGTKCFIDGDFTNSGTIVVVLMSVMMVVISLERIATPLIAVRSVKEPNVSATKNIVFEGVTFAYPSRPHVKVLDNLDLTIATSKNTAIVGPSGSGKSTIVGLIERWYTIQSQYAIAKTGYDTQVGDSGVKLSSGQRQRIAIARSIMRKPKILILDKATSTIDVHTEKNIQAALDRVAKNRTTITIAHRLSTIKKANGIIVLRKGKAIESGTHEDLLEDENGLYYGLVYAQKLSLGEPTEPDVPHSKDDDLETERQSDGTVAPSEADQVSEDAGKKHLNIIDSFGRLLKEQRDSWPFYVGMVFISACAAAGTPLQAWLFAKIIIVFLADSDEEMMDEAELWSLMFVVLASSVGASFFVKCYVSTHLQHRISAAYKRQYFEAMLFQKTAFFDDEPNSQGRLVSRISGEPKQLEELLGLNMAFLLTAIFQLTGSLSIAYSFGWKLALIGMWITMPLSLFSGFWRFKYELEFEKINAAVFAEGSQFTAEAISGFRTVSALTLKDTISTRYSKLLANHISSAFKKARWTSLIFGFADSVNIGCQGLIFWYGSRLLASREYTIEALFVYFMAITQGANAAGQGLSFGPNAALATAASNRIINMRDSRNTDTHSESEDMPDAEDGAKIELKDAHFKYPTRNVSIFQGIDITVEKGQFAALIGPSGYGKTSIISLLERFYDLEKGDILCNGKSIYDLNAYKYRRRLLEKKGVYWHMCQSQALDR
ncbi:hypothetical protein CEP54_015233 [Fusarium duplospermum]|uniref:ABC transporter n=1 Tax=Fusarium duplospermum TaxID=1325734 RepID=A0A428NQL9_9HYPO|nr:hypothetical protein CEP54_015233 [Fusarium duplospermum]